MTQTQSTDSRRLKPVPLAPSVWWGMLRMQVLPVLIFVSVVGVVAYMWRNMDGGGIPAVAEGIRTIVTVPQNAMVTDLKVSPFQWVEAGDPVATLTPVEDPRLEVDLIQSELQLARMQIEPSLADQNAIDFERLRVEALRLQQEIAAAEVQLARAEAALKRNTLLRGEKLVSEDDYDLSLRDRDLYTAELAQKRQSFEQIGRRIETLRSLGEPDFASTNRTAHALLNRVEQRLSQAAPGTRRIELVAPISGMVHLVNRQQGEIVTEGEPLITVQASRSDRIVGYLRQPYPVEPEVGMPVEVLTRSRVRKRFLSEVRQVGAQLEMITNSLAFLRPGLLVDAGLPIVVDVPDHVTIRPGETVDLIFRSSYLKAADLQETSNAL